MLKVICHLCVNKSRLAILQNNLQMFLKLVAQVFALSFKQSLRKRSKIFSQNQSSTTINNFIRFENFKDSSSHSLIQFFIGFHVAASLKHSANEYIHVYAAVYTLGFEQRS